MSVSQYQTGPPFSCSPVVHQIEGRRSPGFSNSRNATKWRYSSRGYRLRTSANVSEQEPDAAQEWRGTSLVGVTSKKQMVVSLPQLQDRGSGLPSCSSYGRCDQRGVS